MDQELINWLKDAAEKAEGFVEREAPQLASEIVAWHFWSSIAGIAFVCVIVAVLLIAAAAISHEGSPDISTWDKGDYRIMGLILCTIAAVLASIGVGANGYEAIKAACRRVVIIEYVRGAVK